MPSHTHVQDAHSHVVSGYTNAANSGSNFYVATVGINVYGSYSTQNTTATNQNTGGSSAFSILQPSRSALLVIKT